MAPTTPDRQLGWIVFTLIALLLVFPAVTMGFGLMGAGPMMGGAWDHGMWGPSDGSSDWMLIVGVGVQLLFLSILVGAGYLAFNALTSRDVSTDPALEELRSAYARGDLDDEEFERRRERLEAGQ